MRVILIVLCVGGFIVMFAAAIGVFTLLVIVNDKTSPMLDQLACLCAAGVGTAIASGLGIGRRQARSAPYRRYNR